MNVKQEENNMYKKIMIMMIGHVLMALKGRM
jgi:hypothetical protein